MRVGRMAAGFLVLAMTVGGMAHAQQQAPAELRFTPGQWACLQMRMTNLRAARADVVRVPLSPCNAGSVTRGVGASNATVANGGAPQTPESSARQRGDVLRDPSARLSRETTARLRLTTGPLFLTKAQLACLAENLGELSAERESAVSFTLADCD